MKPNFKAVCKSTPAAISLGEQRAIEQLLADGERYGYGNLMAWLATAWVKRVPQLEGSPVEITPYPQEWLEV